MGLLCKTRQDWTFQWLAGEKPTLSKDARKIILDPVHDVPLVFAASPQEGTPSIERGISVKSSATATPDDILPKVHHAEEEAGHVSETAGEEELSSAGEGEPSASTNEDGLKTARRPGNRRRKKQRIVKSKFSVPASARHNYFTHFPLDKNCEICKMVKKHQISLQNRHGSGTRRSTTCRKVWRQIDRRP